MSDSSQSQILESWISTFCGMTGHEYFAEVSEDFIEDDFNLTGLGSQVPHYKEALEIILDVEPADDEEDDEDDEALEDLSDEDDAEVQEARTRTARLHNHQVEVETAAELLYGLIHQRYITSRPGISQMNEKYELGHFGHCPRVHCNLTKVLPVGCSDMPGTETVKLFCPSCLDVYTPPNSRFQSVDGAFFGTTFGCLFLMTYPDLQIGPLRDLDQQSSISMDDEQRDTSSSRSRQKVGPSHLAMDPVEINGVSTQNFAPGLGIGNTYEPKVYGFKVAEQSKTGPRMKWLRMKPDDVRELDEVTRYYSVMEDVEEDGEEDDGEGYDGQEGGDPIPLASRKKAPMRRRRPVSETGNNNGLGSGINGVG